MTTELRKRVVVTNYLSATVTCITLFWYGLFSIFSETLLDAASITVLIGSAAVPWLNRLGKHTLARLALLSVTNGGCFAFAIALGNEAGVQLIFLPLVCAPLALFDLRERAAMVFGLSLPILLFGLTHHYQLDHAALLTTPLYSLETVHLISTATMVMLLFAIIGLLYHVNAASEAQLEQRYRQLLSHAADSLLFCNERGRVIETNEEARRALGYDDDALCQMTLFDIDAGLNDHEWREILEQLELHPSVLIQSTYTCKDGRSFPVEVRYGRVRHGEQRHVLIGARDISERKELEAQLRLTDRMVSVGTLAAGVAHEINNPLAYISLNLEQIAKRLPTAGRHVDGSAAEQLRSALEMARQGTNQVATIVRDLKTFSHASEETTGAVDVERLLETTIRMAKHELDGRAELHCEFGAVPMVVGNESKLAQVFLNLLLNAAQAMPGDRHDGRVVIRTKLLDDHRVVVEVEDNGSGISHEAMPRIFDPFFTTKSATTGTGLGLYVCRNIVDECGGSLQVHSTPGLGTTFQVTLPQEPPAAQARTRKHSGEQLRSDAEASPDSEPGQPSDIEAHV